MKVAVSGSTGLVGSRLRKRLIQEDHEVLPIVRRSAKPAEVHWDPAQGAIEADKLEGVNAVIHLAGENIAAGRWTNSLKKKIRDSRVQGTELISRTIAGLQTKPRVLICASAIGFYGDRGSEILTENSPAGEGFLPDLCQQWEAAAQPARDAGIRVVHLRLGIVLNKKGGALAKMLPLFKLGGGGIVGSGQQFWSWITLDDVCGAMLHCLTHDALNGPVNATAPGSVTNREFTKVLAKAVHRWALFPAPAFMLRIVLGEMADGLLLASARVQPTELEKSGYRFQAADLESGLKLVLAEA